MAGGIEIKNSDEIAYMREASLIVYEVLEELTNAVAPGVTLDELDAIAERETVKRGAVCAFKGLYGFPRTVPQATALDEILQRRGRKIDHVILLQVPLKVLLDRLAGRQVCPKCQTSYGRNSPPKKPGICDKDGEKLEVRPDDQPERVQQRLQEYESKTALLTGYYKARGVVRPVDGVGSVDEVEKRIEKALS